MTPVSHFDSEAELRRYEALLHMADLVVCHHDLQDLFRDVAERLSQVISFNLINFALHDPATNIMQLRYWEAADTAVEDPGGLPVDEAPSGWVWQNQVPLIIHDTDVEDRFASALRLIRKAGVRCYCCVPLTTFEKRMGGMGLGRVEPNSCGEDDVRFLQRVAALVALAIQNATTKDSLQQEKDRLQVLLEANAALVSSLDLQHIIPVISESIRKVVKHDHASLALFDEKTQTLHQYATDLPDCSAVLVSDFPLRRSGAGCAFLDREVRIFSRTELAALKSPIPHELEGMQRLCCIPLFDRKGVAVGTFNLANRQENAFGPQELGLLKQIAGQIAIALDNARAYAEIAALKDKLAEEKVYLEGEIRSGMNFEEIIGESPVLKRILEQTKTVAPSNATVLLLGETGTGKELIARAIHRMSQRKDASFIKMNCAAIPTGLLESELFGHERGAFTGAISQKIGRLELADKGTLFLDEIGDISLEIQPKLLRVLQDQEFERLGSTRTIRVNVRMIAATNRDLAVEVANKEFRSDLYYRLNVFPIRLPELRERREDIPLLVRYFVQKFARRMNRRIERVPPEAMEALCAWNWPGNVRELENFIERSVILSRGEILNVPMAELAHRGRAGMQHETLESLEREYIIRVLREAGGTIAGPRGAAARLGLKRTTLQSRIQRMGISRAEYGN